MVPCPAPVPGKKKFPAKPPERFRIITDGVFDLLIIQAPPVEFDPSCNL
jgi:hypothetical protein